MALHDTGTVSLEQALAAGSAGIADRADRADEAGVLARSIGNFLTFAIDLAAATHEIHQQRIVRGAINPATIHRSRAELPARPWCACLPPISPPT